MIKHHIISEIFNQYIVMRVIKIIWSSGSGFSTKGFEKLHFSMVMKPNIAQDITQE